MIYFCIKAGYETQGKAQVYGHSGSICWNLFGSLHLDNKTDVNTYLNILL